MNRFTFSSPFSVFLAFGVSALLLCGAAFAQNGNPNNGNPNNGNLNNGNPNNSNVPGSLNAQITLAERTQNADALLLAYGQAVTDANLARAAIAQLLASYYQLRNQAQTAEQATQAVAEANLRFQVLQAAQNQIQIAQNQQLLEQNARIIALLQQNAKK